MDGTVPRDAACAHAGHDARLKRAAAVAAAICLLALAMRCGGEVNDARDAMPISAETTTLCVLSNLV